MGTINHTRRLVITKSKSFTDKVLLMIFSHSLLKAKVENHFNGEIKDKNNPITKTKTPTTAVKAEFKRVFSKMIIAKKLPK